MGIMQKFVQKECRKLIDKGNKLFKLDLPYLSINYGMLDEDIYQAKLVLYSGFKNITLHANWNLVKKDVFFFVNEILPHEIAHYFDIFLCKKLPIKQKHSLRFKKILNLLKGGEK